MLQDNSGAKFWNDNPNQGWGAEGWYPATFALPVQVRLSLLNLCWIATNLAFQAEIKARLTCDLACRSLYCGVARFFACSPPTQTVFFVSLTDLYGLRALCRLYDAISARTLSLFCSLIGV